MNSKNLIPIKTICKHYKVETSFINGLSEHGLLKITTVQKASCIHEDHVQNFEKMIRLHQDLELNFQGIDTVLNLLERVETLQSELQSVKRRLGIYEEKQTL